MKHNIKFDKTNKRMVPQIKYYPVDLKYHHDRAL
jgi:hypothetical protein